jgi:hypothetical protein
MKVKVNEPLDIFLNEVIEPASKYFYSKGWTKWYGEEYSLPTERIIEVLAYANIPVQISADKLAYYVRNKFIPAPMRSGIKSTLGGTAGRYKAKVVSMIWYIYELNKRGIKNHDEIRKYLYSYFSSNGMPPKPVSDTPFVERLIYTHRLNKIPIHCVPEIVDFNLSVVLDKVENIPCKKVSYYYKNYAVLQNLFPSKNINLFHL